MSARPEPLAYRRLRAPREHGQALIDPPLAEAGQLLVRNQQRAGDVSSTWGSWLHGLRQAAREDLFRAAVDYTRHYQDVAAPDFAGTPLILAGHQPQLFHAGVWFKTFVLSSLAAKHRAVGINLLVDNDTMRAASIRIPGGSATAPGAENVAFDASSNEVPFEERLLLDESLFDSFAGRVAAQSRPWIDRPLVHELWPLAQQAHGRTNNLGEILSNARHALEGTWGQNTLEVPLSHVLAQRSFRQFAAGLLLEAPCLWTAYNAALNEYRVLNGIRSLSHPVPRLILDEGWHESPLWVWTSQQPRRNRLFVRRTRDALELTDRERIRETLPAAEHGVVDAISKLERRGIKIRPRALLTTMYARLVLSDLFIHGIGGAKYDELTDAIIRRFFGIEPPSYLTVTATIQLPLDYPRVSGDDVLLAQHELREMQFHPERSLSQGAGAELVARKAELLASVPPRGHKKAWHRQITSLNESLQPLVQEQRRQLEQRIVQLTEEHRVARLLGSREFSFCLFPADFLHTLLLDLSAFAT